MNSTNTLTYCDVSSEPGRAYQLEERRSFQSIKYQFTLDPFSFHQITYLQGELHIALFCCCCVKPRPYRQKQKKSEVLIQEEAIPHTIITVCVCVHIYTYIYVVNTYTVMQKRAVERRASQCWCSMGNPLHRQGSPVSTGCWEVLGYWVWAWIKAVTETGISDFCLCAAGLRVPKGSLFLFSCFLFFF